MLGLGHYLKVLKTTLKKIKKSKIKRAQCNSRVHSDIWPIDPTRKPNLSSICHHQSSILWPSQDQSLKVVAAAATQTTIHSIKIIDQ